MEVEDHDYALACSNISRSFRVFLVDGERALHAGDAPMPGKLLGVRADEADRPQLDAHTENLPFAPALARYTSR